MRRAATIAAALAALAALAAGVVGCGGKAHDTGRRGSATSATPRPLPQPSARCGSPEVRAHTVRFPARGGPLLDGAVVGSGALGVVLIHEYPGPMCGWWPYATYLAAHGMRALLFDLRCFGLSQCPRSGRGHPVDDVAGAMAELRRAGARRVALVGASMGGTVAVVAGAQLHPAAIVDLSGEANLDGLTPGIVADALAAAPRLRAPALFAVARQDRYTSVPAMRAVFAHARSSTKQIIVLGAAAGHGWDMLDGIRTTWSPLAARVARFLTGQARAA